MPEINFEPIQGTKDQYILVTGATGFIGVNLCMFLTKVGYNLITFSRSGTSIIGEDICKKWFLGDSIDLSDLPTPTTAIHLAHDFNGKIGGDITISGTLQLISSLRSIGVKHQIFVSSYSAGPHAKSRYGKTKARIESALINETDITIARPGLVIGGHGIYGRIIAWAQKYNIAPLPDGGNGLVPIIGIDQLCEELLTICLCPPKRGYANLFENDLCSLRQLITAATQTAGKSPIIIPIPTKILLPLLQAIEKMGIPLPVTSDSLLGFAMNQRAQHKSTLKAKSDASFD